ncbi:hypothetical protein [Amphritea japonica]|uniref:hypothetical protein n=1 Tax=Amphritea japonica TaxID=452627 RepID=UPI00036F4EC5|nr:hypothetical protein [Amphritea japonica]
MKKLLVAVALSVLSIPVSAKADALQTVHPFHLAFAAVNKCIEPTSKELNRFNAWYLLASNNAALDLSINQRDITYDQIKEMFDTDIEHASQAVNQAFEETGCQAKEIKRSIEFFHTQVNTGK